MSAWTTEELAAVGGAEELEIASRRRDGSLRSPTTIWVVRDGGDIYVRSVNGPGSAWFRSTRVQHAGRIRAAGVEKDVTFEDVGHDADEPVDAAYRTKYSRYAASIIDAITSPGAQSTTLRLVPRSGPDDFLEDS